MLESFDLTYAKTIDDAIKLKKKLGDGASFYAGGTELLQVLKEGMVVYDNLISLRSLNDLKKIEFNQEKGVLEIGALVTHAMVANSKLVRQLQPALSILEDNVGNIRIRISGTVGGNLAFAEPRSDLGAYLVAAEATVCTKSLNKTRRIPMSEFWHGPFETALEDDELITHIEVPIMKKRCGAAYKKFSIAEFPMAGAAAFIELDEKLNKIIDARLVVAAVNPTPTRLTTAEKLMIDKPISIAEKEVSWWVKAIEPEIDAVSDLDGSPEYKTQVAAVLLCESISVAIQKAKEVSEQ